METPNRSKSSAELALQLGRGTHEQDNASAEITRGAEQMRHLGLEVKGAVQEQHRESSLITRSVETVAAKIKQISIETRAQSKRADQILDGGSVHDAGDVDLAAHARDVDRGRRIDHDLTGRAQLDHPAGSTAADGQQIIACATIKIFDNQTRSRRSQSRC